METGTGKTYVYLRTVFELNQKYGFKKFIVVVPSVAIREGVLKSIEITKEHFAGIYDNVPFMAGRQSAAVMWTRDSGTTPFCGRHYVPEQGLKKGVAEEMVGAPRFELGTS